MRQTELRRSYYPQSSELALIPDASTEKEKESLRAWVEMGLKRQANRDDATAEKRFWHQEDTLSENGINGTVENTYRNEKVLKYVNKRCVVVTHPLASTSMPSRGRTVRTEVIAWGKCIRVTLTTEAATVQEWICGQSGCLFGMDVEWRPNRVRGVENKAALLQLCSESECLIIQLLFLDGKPEALRELLFNPLKSLAGVGVHSDSKRLLKDHGLLCQGEIELTILAAERLKREELKHAGLKALVSQVLGLSMKKSKSITLSDWSRRNLNPAQVEYACIDAWVSLALAEKLTGENVEAI